MTRLKNLTELVTRLCPEGVPFVPLAEVLKYEQPTKHLVQSTDYHDSFATPVLTAGQTFILGYTDEEIGIYPASRDEPVIIFDDFTTAFRWVDFPFKAKSSAMKMLRPNSREVDFRYVYLAMTTIGFRPQEHARHWIGQYSRFRVPLPPLEVQREIVLRLDAMLELQGELRAELRARRAQYGLFREHLLTFPTDGTVAWRALGEVSEIRSGWGFPHVDQGLKSGDYPFYKVSDMNLPDNESMMSIANNYVSESTARRLGARPAPMGTVIFPKIGAAIATGKKRILTVPAAYDNNVMGIVPSHTMNPRFLLYWFETFDLMKLAHDSGAVPSIRKGDVERLPIPVPNREDQDAIVADLDAFNSLLTDRKVGLPAEIAAREIQYAHYRTQLFNFEEAPA